jgi:hypothetical protein
MIATYGTFVFFVERATSHNFAHHHTKHVIELALGKCAHRMHCED